MAAIPDALIDTVSLCGPPDVVRERLAVYRDAGVGTLGVTPIAFTAAERLEQLRLVAELAGRLSPAQRHDAPRRHPAGRLRRPRARLPDDRPRARARRARARGHAADLAALAGARRGRGPGLRAGARVPRVPHRRREPLDFYEAVVHATRDTLPLVRELAPDVVVADILTLAPALAAELERRPLRDAHPPRLPRGRARLPDLLARRAPAAHGARARVLAPRRSRPVERGLSGAAHELNQHPRAARACRRSTHVHGGISRELALVATFPQLEYPRAGLRTCHVVGPLMWEPPAARRRAPAGRCAARAGRALDRPGPRAPAAARRAARARRRARAGARHLEPPPALPRRCRCPTTPASSTGSPTRARCRAATSSSATPATARSCARSPAAAPSSPARASAT